MHKTETIHLNESKFNICRYGVKLPQTQRGLVPSGALVCAKPALISKMVYSVPARVHHLNSTRVIGQLEKRCEAAWVNLKDPVKLTYLNVETC